MDRATLLELCDQNYLEANREFSRRAGGTVLDEDGVSMWAGGHPLPVLVNAAFPIGSRLTAEALLARARVFFAERRRGYSVIAPAHSHPALAGAAEAAGLVRFGASPGMVLEHRLPDVAPAAGIEVRQVTTAADVDAFVRATTAAWATVGMPEDVAPALFARPASLCAPHIVAFVACEGETPLAAAMAILSHGIAGVYWVGTAPTARGRGLAELCTRAAGNAAFDLGARLVTLQASKMGEPVYRRMGYVEVTRYPYYVRFTPPEA